VAGQHQKVLRATLGDPVPVLPDRVRGSPVPVVLGPPLKRLEELDAASLAVEIPRPSDPNVVAEGKRAVLRENADVEDAGVDAIGEREVDDPVLAAEGHRRLRALLGEQAEPAPEPSREDHGVGDEAHRPRRSRGRTVEPEGISPRSKSDSRTPFSISTFFPIRAPAGISERFPMTVRPAEKSSGWSGCRPGAPMPTSAPSPIRTCLSTIA